MNSDLLVQTIDTHTAGEPTRIVLSGLKRINLGEGTVEAKRDRFAETADWIRELVLCEPRGHDDMFGAVLVEPSRPEADLGVFFMDTGGYLDMCGHATIGVVTALIETGQLEQQPVVTLETPAGLVEARPTVTEGSVERVAVRNVESFYVTQETLEIEWRGEPLDVTIDVVSSGNVVALVDADQLGLTPDRDTLDSFVELGARIDHRLSESPNSEERPISLVEFYQPNEPVDRNIVVFGDGAVDRSPCGTGTCAKMTLLHKRGELAVDERYRYEGVLGTQFSGRIVERTERNGTTITTPEIAGPAYIVAKNTLLKDPADSITGFQLNGK